MTRWDDKKVEDHLQQLPPIKDRQSKEELFQAIQKKMADRGDLDSKPIKIKRRKTWVYPAIASVAALFLIVLLLPSMLNGGGQQHLTGEDNNGVDEVNGNMGIMTENDDQNNMNIAGSNETDEDQAGMAGITGIPDEEAFISLPVPHLFHVNKLTETGTGIFPIATIISKQFDPAAIEKASLEETLYYTLTSGEVIWASFPLEEVIQSVEVNEEETIVTLDFVNERSIERLASSESDYLWQAFEQFFGFYGFETLQFTANGDPGVYWGQSGILETEWSLPNENRGYYRFRDEDGAQYLVRATVAEEPIEENGDLLSFSETIEKMRVVSEGAWYESVIPVSVVIEDVVVQGEHAFVTLTDDSEFSDVEEYHLFIEALLLTASDFSIDYLTIEGGQSDSIRETIYTEMMDVIDVPTIY
ncbi:hypothetical protein ACERII_04885 [Evansella sp. AB-rgal1]|uniref:hypothetical protein n=1 Tax=Evansella sp. AB-rgal1 TaxID=3242696 RepID=UPI00359D0283